jgi:hypothetical protein
MAIILAVPLVREELRPADRVIGADGDQAPQPLTLSSPSKAPRVSAGLFFYLGRRSSFQQFA